MRADASFAVPVKLWALLCVFVGVNLGNDVLLTCIMTGWAFLYLLLQQHFRLAVSYGCFYLVLALLLYGIRFHGLHMPIFSEFYVLMFWKLSPIFMMSWDDYDPAGNALCLFFSCPHAHICHSRASCPFSLLSDHAGGAEERGQVDEKQRADQDRAAAGTSHTEHGICHDAVSTQNIAACGSAVCFRRCKRSGAPGRARQLL